MADMVGRRGWVCKVRMKKKKMDGDGGDRP
jgi:hypothetical protein